MLRAVNHTDTVPEAADVFQWDVPLPEVDTHHLRTPITWVK